MAEQAKAAGSGTYLGALWGMGESMVAYASSALGYEDFKVIDPNAKEAKQGDAAVDEGVHGEMRKQTWGSNQFQQYIGMDVTSLLSVPVWIMEPVTILQKASEIMQYTELLDKASECNDKFERFAYVAAYLVSPFGGAERAWKPFNPILGETFEIEVGNGVKFLAEQVSHHPPVAACHAENEHFLYDIVSAPTTRFLGNSLEVFPHGRTRITLRKHNELYTQVPPNLMAHNIVLGKSWIDVFGTLTVVCPTTGVRCELEFKPCGWFGYGRYEFVGYVCDADGAKKIKLFGKWNSHVDMLPCGLDGEPPVDAEPTRMWTCSPKPKGDYYGFTTFAHVVSSSEGIKEPLASDSRRRADRAHLYKGETGPAGTAKHQLEEMQRAEKRERDANGGSWVPRWFRKVEEPELFEGDAPLDKVPFWEWNGEHSKLLEAKPGNAEEIEGKGFCPWQFPDLHASS
ncbi:hypothetical protein FOA52_015862 [Chlamydomonas sp. UWO 241]|nr:hypothetical protein FOA52_015862 [Chlamydomonas sp. UWO 241]